MFIVTHYHEKRVES